MPEKASATNTAVFFLIYNYQALKLLPPL